MLPKIYCWVGEGDLSLSSGGAYIEGMPPLIFSEYKLPIYVIIKVNHSQKMREKPLLSLVIYVRRMAKSWLVTVTVWLV